MILLLVGASERAIEVVRDVAGSVASDASRSAGNGAGSNATPRYPFQIQTGATTDRPDWVIAATAADRDDAIRRYRLPTSRVVEIADVGTEGGPAPEMLRGALERMTEIGSLPAGPAGSVRGAARQALLLVTEWATWIAVDEVRQRLASHALFTESKLGAAARARVLLLVPDRPALAALSPLLHRLARDRHSLHAIVTHTAGADDNVAEWLQMPAGAVTLEPPPSLDDSPWRPLVGRLQRMRAALRRPTGPLRIAPAGAFVRRATDWIEHALPPELDLITFLEQRRPDVLVVVPHRFADSPEIDFYRVARTLGIPSICLPLHWDDFQSAQDVQPEKPDTVAAWSGTQQREAAAYFDLEINRVKVTGPLLPSDIVPRAADAGDHASRDRDRARYCDRLAIDPSRRIVLFEAPNTATADFVKGFQEWRRGIKESDAPELRGAAIVVYVQNASEVAAWRRLAATEEIAVARAGDSDRAPHRLHESLAAADVVVAHSLPFLLEAGTRDKPAVVLLDQRADASTDLARFCGSARGSRWPSVTNSVTGAIASLAAGLGTNPQSADASADAVGPSSRNETADLRVHRLIAEMARRPMDTAPVQPSVVRRLTVLLCAWLARRFDRPGTARSGTARSGRDTPLTPSA